MFGNVGTPELILIFSVVLLFFGANKIPEFARGLGQDVRAFKKAMRNLEENVQREVMPTGQSISKQHSQPNQEH